MKKKESKPKDKPLKKNVTKRAPKKKVVKRNKKEINQTIDKLKDYIKLVAKNTQPPLPQAQSQNTPPQMTPYEKMRMNEIKFGVSKGDNITKLEDILTNKGLLGAEQTELNKIVFKLRQDQKDREDDIKRKEEELARKQEEYNALLDNETNTRQQIADITANLRDIEQQQALLQQENAELQRQKRATGATVRDLREIQRRLENQNTAYLREGAELYGRNQELARNIEDKTQTIQAQQLHINTQQERLEALQREAGQLQGQIVGLQARITTLNDEIQYNRQQNTTLLETIQQTTNQNVEMLRQIAENQNRINTQAEELRTLTQAKELSTAQRDRAVAEMQNLKGEMRQLRQMHNAIKTDNEKLLGDIETLKKDKELFVKENTRLMEETQKQIATIEQIGKRITEEERKNRQIVNDNQELVRNIEQSKQDLQNARTLSTIEKQKLKDELEAQKTEADKTIKALKETEKELRNEQKDLEKQKAKLIKDLQKMSKDKQKLNTELDGISQLYAIQKQNLQIKIKEVAEKDSELRVKTRDITKKEQEIEAKDKQLKEKDESLKKSAIDRLKEIADDYYVDIDEITNEKRVLSSDYNTIGIIRKGNVSYKSLLERLAKSEDSTQQEKLQKVIALHRNKKYGADATKKYNEALETLKDEYNINYTPQKPEAPQPLPPKEPEYITPSIKTGTGTDIEDVGKQFKKITTKQNDNDEAGPSDPGRKKTRGQIGDQTDVTLDPALLEQYNEDALKFQADLAKIQADLADTSNVTGLPATTDVPTEGTGKTGNTPLWNYEIDDIMMDQNMLKHGFKGSYATDQLQYMKLNKDDKKIGFVLNTIKSTDKKVGHWVGVVIDKNNNSVCYYDSFADQPPENFIKIISPILKKMGMSIVQVKINNVKKQTNNSNRCGFHSMKFLIEMLKKNATFKQASGFKIIEDSIKGEKNIKKFQESLKPFKQVKI